MRSSKSARPSGRVAELSRKTRDRHERKRAAVIWKWVVGTVFPLILLALAYHDIKFQISFIGFSAGGGARPGVASWKITGLAAITQGIAFILLAISLHLFFWAKRVPRFQNQLWLAARYILGAFFLAEIAAIVMGYIYRVDT